MSVIANPHSEKLSTFLREETLSGLQSKDNSGLLYSNGHRNSWGWSPRDLESPISPFNC